jgi:hypothetical protein
MMNRPRFLPNCGKSPLLLRASADDARWFATATDRECGRFGPRVELSDNRRLTLVPRQAA